MEKVKLLTLYLEPDSNRVILETECTATSMSLSELRLVTQHLQGWIYEIAKVALRASGFQVNKKED